MRLKRFMKRLLHEDLAMMNTLSAVHAMWETTFPRLTHAGLGKPINEDNILLSMHDASLGPFPNLGGA